MSALAARVRALSPFGPIFGKELRVTARRRRSYLLRVVYLALLLLLLMMAWLTTRNLFNYGPGMGGGVMARTAAQEQLAKAFFVCFVGFTTCAMTLIGPVLTATAVSSERLGRTLNVLLMTPITAWQVISGKLLSRLLIALTLIGLSLPVLALSRLLGGVELSQMLAGVCLATAVAVHTAAIGLFFSTILRRAFAVILLSYITIAITQAFVPFVLIGGFDIGDSQRGMSGWAHFNWFVAMVSIMEPRAIGGRGGPIDLGIPAWAACSLFYVALAGVLVVCSGLLLRGGARREGGRATAPDPSEYIPVAGVARPAPQAPTGSSPPPLPQGAPGGATDARAEPLELTVDPEPDLWMQGSPLAYAPPTTSSGPRATAPRDVSDHPVLWREVRRPLTARRWQAIGLCVGAGALLLTSYAVLAANNSLDDDDAQVGYAIVFHGLLWLLVAVVSATSVAQEKESDTWTLLLTTPVSGRAIVFGKAAGLLRRLMWPYALAAGHFALFTVTGIIRPEAFVFLMWVMVTFNTLWLATGVYLSLRLRTVTFAVILNLLLAIGAYGVAPLLLLAGGEWLDDSGYDSGYRRGGEAWGEQVCWYLPYSYLGIGLEGIDRARRNPTTEQFWLPRDLTYAPPSTISDPEAWRSPYFRRRVDAPTYFAVTFAVGCGYLLASLALLYWTATRFDRIVGRAPQRAPAVNPPASTRSAPA